MRKCFVLLVVFIAFCCPAAMTAHALAPGGTLCDAHTFVLAPAGKSALIIDHQEARLYDLECLLWQKDTRNCGKKLPHLASLGTWFGFSPQGTYITAQNIFGEAYLLDVRAALSGAGATAEGVRWMPAHAFYPDRQEDLELAEQRARFERIMNAIATGEVSENRLMSIVAGDVLAIGRSEGSGDYLFETFPNWRSVKSPILPELFGSPFAPADIEFYKTRSGEVEGVFGGTIYGFSDIGGKTTAIQRSLLGFGANAFVVPVTDSSDGVIRAFSSMMSVKRVVRSDGAYLLEPKGVVADGWVRFAAASAEGLRLVTLSRRLEAAILEVFDGPDRSGVLVESCTENPVETVLEPIQAGSETWPLVGLSIRPKELDDRAPLVLFLQGGPTSSLAGFRMPKAVERLVELGAEVLIFERSGAGGASQEIFRRLSGHGWAAIEEDSRIMEAQVRRRLNAKERRFGIWAESYGALYALHIAKSLEPDATTLVVPWLIYRTPEELFGASAAYHRDSMERRWGSYIHDEASTYRVRMRALTQPCPPLGRAAALFAANDNKARPNDLGQCARLFDVSELPRYDHNTIVNSDEYSNAVIAYLAALKDDENR